MVVILNTIFSENSNRNKTRPKDNDDSIKHNASEKRIRFEKNIMHENKG